MAVLKCKMCGSVLYIEEGQTVCECEYCGSVQTVPQVDDEKKLNLYNRANRLRSTNEFDKAYGVFESLVADFPEESEAYWGLCLCKYGIEYVDDPATGKKMPTCHRTSYDSIFDDPNFEMALEYADGAALRLYREEAKEIDRLQKAILEIAKTEDPFDIFICYKETEDDGDRTVDSVIAQDVYTALVSKGYKTFFSRITLEDKLGTAYEPYIFAALNSAKVMLAFGTSYDHYNAVWVKNEWSRFLDLMKNNKDKYLIPCYKDMDVYDMPKEFAHLQAQDMGKVGALQDLLRGVDKIFGRSDEQRFNKMSGADQTHADRNSVGSLIKRGNMALEDEDWEKADGFFEEALNRNAECADAFIGKWLAEEECSTLGERFEELKEENDYAYTETLNAIDEDVDHVQKAADQYTVANYLSAETIKKLYDFDRSYKSSLNCRKKQKEDQLAELAENRHLSRALRYAQEGQKQQFEAYVAGLRNTFDERIRQAQEEDNRAIERIRTAYAQHLEETDNKVADQNREAQEHRDRDYQKAVFMLNNAKTVQEFLAAADAFSMIGNYLDCEARQTECQQRASQLEKKGKTKRNKIIASAIALLVLALAVTFLITTVVIPGNKYKQAVQKMESGQFEEAYNLFESLGTYKDSREQCRETIYRKALRLMEAGEYSEADDLLEVLGEYKDSTELISECFTQIMRSDTGGSLIGSTVYYGYYEQDGNTDNGKEAIQWTILSQEEGKALLISTNVLDTVPYNNTKGNVTWQTCSLREWLNTTFFDAAFSSAEQEQIVTTIVSADRNPKFDTSPGNPTQDKVFLLSVGEANKYFKSDSDRQCRPTQYAIEHGVGTSGEMCTWHLRTPGTNSTYAASVDFDGEVSCFGGIVDNTVTGVRPVIWVNY